MQKIPICAIDDCENNALLMFGDQWICGECMTAYHREQTEALFKDMQDKLKEKQNAN